MTNENDVIIVRLHNEKISEIRINLLYLRIIYAYYATGDACI